jgi:hypothetical protein
MHANISSLKKSIHLIPIIPVYLVVFTVIYGFTEYFFLDFFNITKNNKSGSEIENLFSSFFYIFNTITIIVFYFSASMVIINHLLAMFSNPGKNPYWEKDIENMKDLTEETYCKKCLLVRPERAHHCKICNKCILKMDHHCPWIANCVGLCNIKYFILFLFYATLGNFIAFICLFSRVFYIDIDNRINESTENNKEITQWEIFLYLKDPLICIIATILAFFMTISIGFLFVMQIWNLFINQTTIENKIYKNKNFPYKYNDNLDNIKSIMGNNYFIWFLPIYYEDQSYNMKKIKSQANYLSLCEIEDPNLELGIKEI